MSEVGLKVRWGIIIIIISAPYRVYMPIVYEMHSPRKRPVTK